MTLIKTINNFEVTFPDHLDAEELREAQEEAEETTAALAEIALGEDDIKFLKDHSATVERYFGILDSLKHGLEDAGYAETDFSIKLPGGTEWKPADGSIAYEFWAPSSYHC